MIRSTIAAFFAFLFFLTIHFLFFYYFNPSHKVNVILICALAGLIFFLILILFFPQEGWFRNKFNISEANMKWGFLILGALFYGFLFLGYLEFYFTADRSITFRMLMVTAKQREHSITQEQMFTIYDTEGIIKRRFSDLVYGGFYTLKGNIYYLTPKGEFVLRIYRIAIKMLHLDNGEKDDS